MHAQRLLKRVREWEGERDQPYGVLAVFKLRRISFIAVLTIMALAPAPMAPSPQGAELHAGPPHLEKEVEGDLRGNGKVYKVLWFSIALPPTDCSRCPPDHLPAVNVLPAGANGGTGKLKIVAGWMVRQPTSIPDFYPDVNRLWPIPGGGNLISVAVQYGARVLSVHMLRLEGNALKEVWHWVGMSASAIRLGGRLVLKTQSDDYFQVPRLHAWTGKSFGDVSREFPSFYAKLAAGYRLDPAGKMVPRFRSYDWGVLHDQNISVGALVGTCQLALEAYNFAQRPGLGRKVCLDARERIIKGNGVMEANPRNNYAAVRRQNAAKIDSLLSDQGK